MNKTSLPQAISSPPLTSLGEDISGPKRLRLLLYWLAGARWATLAQTPETERERIAVLGSSVLIPTLLAFFGMYLYAASRFAEPRPIASLSIALAWALIIMNVDRILLATYRPFQPPLRRAVQVCFRIGLAGVVSVAITFPFCLHQYRGAIAERLQSEFRQQLDEARAQERTERQLFAPADVALVQSLRAKLDQELATGPTDPQLYAETLAKQALRHEATVGRDQQKELEQEAAAALEHWQQASSRILELEQNLRREERGALPVELGGTGKPGRAAKYNQLLRDLDLARQVELTAKQRYNRMLALALDETVAAAPALAEDKRAALAREAELRAARIDQLEQAVKQAEAEQAQHLAEHTQRHAPVIRGYQAKATGIFDPMEETIGLFKVMFVPEAASNESGAGAGRFKWIAALFQFSVVFGTLFLLDLIAILSKVMSRPGPYDVLVEFPEFVCRQNLIRFKELSRQDDASTSAARASGETTLPGEEVDVRDPAAVAQLLFRTRPGSPLRQNEER